jgi:transcription elongation factor GreA
MMMEEQIVITRQGYEDAKNKLEQLKREQPLLRAEITRAAADKDFRENAPFHAAREKMSYLEGEIQMLENTLRMAKIVESNTGVKVGLGDTVVIENLDDEERSTYTLVGPREANMREGKVSISSPLGQALMGVSVGDTVDVKAPAGVLGYLIVSKL